MKNRLLRYYCIILVLTAFFTASISASAAEAADDEAPVIFFDEDQNTSGNAEIVSVGSDDTDQLHVPKIVIETENHVGVNLTKEDGYVNAHIVITDTDGSVLEDDTSFKVRGNSTAFYTILKKAYTVKFSKKKEVLGMGKGKKWALMSNPYDPTQLRNYIALELARELGLSYTSKQKVAELWLDGLFRGMYVVTVPVEEGKDRVDIDIDSNGGKKDFLLEVEATRVEDDVTYLTASGMRFAMKDPDEPNEEQLAYIKGVMEEMIKTIKSGNEDAIREKLDVASFEKFYLFNEYVKTVDLDFSSVFFYYKDGKLYAGPAWDYDFALGGASTLVSRNYRAAGDTKDFYAKDRSFFKYLCRYQWFMDEARQLYEDHYSYFYRISSRGGELDSLREEYASELDRNYSLAGWKVNRWYMNYQKQPLPTYEENYQFLKTWCAQRERWMTENFNPFKGEYLIGDADFDGKISIIDATKIQKVLAQMLTDDGMTALRADADLDGLDVIDATNVQKTIALIENDHHIGETRE